jgi:uncharacterized damage-inducible protein DinB
MDEFNRDVEENLDAIRFARSELLEAVQSLTADDLQRVRRGGWSVQQVLRHVIDSEVAYAKAIGFLRGTPTDLANASEEEVASGSAAVGALERVRGATLKLVDGVDEATFYELRALGKEQYSVVSVLENIASHDHEHLEQISKTLSVR